MHEVTLTAHRRDTTGKEQAKKMRRGGRIPAVVYGHGQPAVPVFIESKELVPVFKTGTGQNIIITLKMADDGRSITTIIKQLQTEPIYNRLLHLDFLEIKMAEKIRVTVPVELTGIPDGVKNQGGILEHVTDTVDVFCLPLDIPEKIVVDITRLKVGQSVHASDVSADKVEVLTDPGQVIAAVIALRAEEEAPAAAAAEPAATAEPEVIGKGKKEEEGEEAEGK